ncbi:MAG TPA: nucleotide-binding protein [Blastocatellia bacterium]|nr:nucleotide-binding protein [Blastocatellia bacterium]
MSTNTEKPTVFIGSSSEDLRIAGQIQYDLLQVAKPQIWSQGVFGLGWGTLEALMTSLERYDFAILALSPNDVVTSKDVTTSAPRDNVIFELGLFMGRLGPRRTFIFYDKSVDLKLLSDLVGITKAEYDGAWAKENLAAAIGAACQPIRETIRSLGPLLKPTNRIGPSTRNKMLEELVNDISSLPRMMTSEEKECWKDIKEHTARLC